MPSLLFLPGTCRSLFFCPDAPTTYNHKLSCTSSLHTSSSSSSHNSTDSLPKSTGFLPNFRGVYQNFDHTSVTPVYASYYNVLRVASSEGSGSRYHRIENQVSPLTVHRTIFRDSAENQHAHIHSLHTSAALRWRIFLLRTPRNCWTNWIFQKRLIAGSVGSHTRARTHPISCGVLRGTTMMKMNVRAEYGIAKMPKKLCLSLTVQKQGAEFFLPEKMP